jgi:hypothetical protein
VCLIKGISFTGTVDADSVSRSPMVDGLFRMEKLLILLKPAQFGLFDRT